MNDNWSFVSTIKSPITLFIAVAVFGVTLLGFYLNTSNSFKEDVNDVRTVVKDNLDCVKNDFEKDIKDYAYPKVSGKALEQHVESIEKTVEYHIDRSDKMLKELRDGQNEIKNMLIDMRRANGN